MTPRVFGPLASCLFITLVPLVGSATGESERAHARLMQSEARSGMAMAGADHPSMRRTLSADSVPDRGSTVEGSDVASSFTRLPTPDLDSPLGGRGGCGGNLHITGNVEYAEPGCSDGSIEIIRTLDIQCGALTTIEGGESLGEVPGVGCENLPLRGARVELWIDLLFEDYLLGVTTTNNSGDFDFCFINNDPSNCVDFYVVVVLCPDATVDGYACNTLPGNPVPWSVRVGPEANSVFVIFSNIAPNVGTGSINWDIIDRRFDTSGGQHVYNLLANEAFDYLQSEVSWTNDVGLQVAFPDGPTEFTLSPSMVHVAPNDEQDPDVVLKAYSEFVLNELYEGALPPVTPDCASHAWGLPSDLGCAMIHGTAIFLQSVIQNDPVFVDTPSPGSPPSVQLDLELPDPPVVSAGDEGAVAASLWDMFDPANEGHDAMAEGLGPIWSVVDTGNPGDFCDFVDDYISTHGSSEELDEILLNHFAFCLFCPLYVDGSSDDPAVRGRAIKTGKREIAASGIGLRGLSLDKPVSPPDAGGSYFFITAEDCYLCLNFKRLGEPPRMVGKCPWWGGCNHWTLYYLRFSELDRPGIYVRSEHTSFDFEPGEPSKDCDQGDFLYEDDVPTPPGMFDWVTQEYDACADVLRVRHKRDPGPDFFSPAVNDLVYEGPGVTGCSGTAFPPAIVCSAPRGQEVAMGMVQTRIVLAGDPEGGTVTLVLGQRSVAVATLVSDTIDDVAHALAVAVNTTPEFEPTAVNAFAVGGDLVLEGTGKTNLSVVTDDQGIIQPNAPTDLSVVIEDSQIFVSWTNADSYDDLQLSKAGRALALDIPGTEMAIVDSVLVNWPGEYVLVGWKDGMPSAPAIVGGAVGVPGSIGTQEVSRRLQVTVHPNPARTFVTFEWVLPKVGEVKITLHNVLGQVVRVFSVPVSGSTRGRLEWDGLSADGSPVAPGIYFARFASGEESITTKVSIVR